MKKKPVQTSIILEDDLYEKLTAIKAEKGTPFAFIINKALKEYLEKMEKKENSKYIVTKPLKGDIFQ
jgi:predicted DNA-binding protein